MDYILNMDGDATYSMNANHYQAGLAGSKATIVMEVVGFPKRQCMCYLTNHNSAFLPSLMC